MRVSYLLLYLQGLEKELQIPGVSAATTAIPSSLADFTNHSRRFPAEPTCRCKPVPDSNRQLIRAGTQDRIYLQSLQWSRTLQAFNKYLLNAQIN